MRRRALLSTLAAAAVPLAAGCSDDGDAGTATDGNAEPTTTETATPSDGTTDRSTDTHTTVTVEQVALQQGYVVREVADAIGVSGDDERYLWAKVSVEGGAFAPDAFSLTVGDVTVAPVENPRAYRFEGTDSPYTLDAGDGWLLFELQDEVTSEQGEVPRVALTRPGGEVTIDRSIAERIAYGPPELSVSVEKQYRETPAKPIAIRVTNEGTASGDPAVAGRFAGALNRRGPVSAVAPIQRVAVDVPAGETRTVEIADDWSDRATGGTDDDTSVSVEYALHWAGGSTRVTFEHV